MDRVKILHQFFFFDNSLRQDDVFIKKKKKLIFSKLNSNLNRKILLNKN